MTLRQLGHQDASKVIEASGTHQLWRGPLDNSGVPRLGRSHRTTRVAWSNYWQVPPQQLEGRRLQRICSPMTCLQPTHHILASPQRVYKGLGWARSARRTAREVFATEGQRGGLRGGWWDTRRIEETPAVFGPPLMVVKALAARMSWPHIAVLALWSERVRQDLKRRQA